MSVFRPLDMACPACGEVARRSLALSVNGGRTPAHRDAILDGSFQRFTCAGCGAAAVADGPLLYIDLGAGHWFSCFPRGWETSWRELEREPEDTWRRVLLQHSPAELRASAEDLMVRAVFGLGALREKLLCAGAGIDDVEIELCKLDLLRRGDPLPMEAAARPLLDAVNVDALTFTATGSTGPLRLSVPRAHLTAIASDQGWLAARRQLRAGPYVDLGRILLPGTHPLEQAWPAP